MNNRDIYQKNPATRKLVNEGVASVNDEKTSQALAVLRYELETFVCDGQYEKGMSHMLDTYLKNIDQAQQPAVWVSGFFGSGKSHLVKMLRALWEDTVFDDGATARGIANLPQDIGDNLMELSTQAKRHGGLHAASGTLGAGASGSVRLALLRIIFKSAGLPEQYPVARFVMWLRQEGIEGQVRAHVEQNGFDWDEELDNFYVAEGLHNEPLGHVVPADYLYFDSADKLLQSRILPRKVHEKTISWNKGSEEEQLMARACGLVFLINKLGSQNNEIGIRATIDTLADLLVENLAHGSSSLRSKLPNLLDKCELLMKVDDEYRIQTEESAAWSDEFLSQRSALSNEAHRIEAERDDRIRKKFGEMVGKLSLTQGDSKVTRDIHPVFDSQLPTDADKRIYVWVRDGWSVDENSVRADSRQAGNQSPTVFVFIPKRSADDLRHHLIDYKAASATLDKRGVPNGPEGVEARAAMETTKQTAEGKIRELLEEAFSGARVFQGGGSEILGNDMQEMVLEASDSGAQRLYAQFHTADHVGWSKVYERVQKGAPDALRAVGDEGEPARNPVCKAILGFIAGGKKGADIRTHFESAPYGWSRDAVDGGLQVLLVAGLIRAQDERGQTLAPKELERKTIGKVMFKVESAIVTAAQWIQIRKLLQKAGLSAKQGEESAYVQQFLEKIRDLADQAGGEAPKPARPDTASLEEIRLTAGNEQLIALYNRRDELVSSIDTWTDLSKRITQRWPNWIELERLSAHASGLPVAEVILSQVKTIEQQRLLLEDPDLVKPLITNLTQLLRDELNKLDSEYNTCHEEGMLRFAADSNWQQLEPEQRNQLLSEQRLTLSDRPIVKVQSTDDLLATLDRCNLTMFTALVAALPGRFDNVAFAAAELCEPEIQPVKVPRRTLKTVDEIDTWAEEVKGQLKAALAKGPVSIR